MTQIILYVEDDENDVLLLQHAINKAGYMLPMQVATDGQHAIDYLSGKGQFANRSEFPIPWLVLLDLKLPYIPGLEVLRWIRQEAALGIPVFILSSSEDADEITKAYELGASAYLVKPSDSHKLAGIARTIMDLWLSRNQPQPKIALAQTSPQPPASGM